MRKYRILYCLMSCLFFGISSSRACQCPLTTLSKEEAAKYEIIFKGKIISLKNCDGKFGEAMFQIEELYKGSVTEKFKVLFECKVECAMNLLVGEEWIIYTKYKQIDNSALEWCSRSRKFFRNESEDFYATTYGNNYYEELKFLRTNLGLHRFIVTKKNAAESRNIKPSTNQTIFLVLCSLVAIVLFYYLFRKYFKL
jgi:hypothetical protein